MKCVVYVFLFLVAGACVDPYTFHGVSSDELLVVDGMITDQPGPYFVKIYNTKPIDRQQAAVNWVSHAQVSITDKNGATETLSEYSPGNYVTSSLQGEVGNTYTLTISTSEGSTYQSIPETLLSVGEITGLQHKFVTREDPTNFRLNTTNGFNIYISANVLPEQENRVRWRWSGTFEIATLPQLRTKTVVGASGAVVITWNPLPCSGYSVRPGNVLTQTGVCTCCNCWTTFYNTTPLVSAPGFIDGGLVKDQLIAFVPANRRIFHNKYEFEVEQLSLSQAVYDFWKKIDAAEQEGSSLFQTPPAETTGNMIPAKSGLKPMIGIFAAASIRKAHLTLFHQDIPYYVPPIDTIKQDCKYTYVVNTTYQKPSFY